MLGQALDAALGDRAGVARYGDARAPLDEALAHATVDLGGRGFSRVDLALRGPSAGRAPGHPDPPLRRLPVAQRPDGDPPRGLRRRRPPRRRGRVQGAGPGAARGRAPRTRAAAARCPARRARCDAASHADRLRRRQPALAAGRIRAAGGGRRGDGRRRSGRRRGAGRAARGRRRGSGDADARAHRHGATRCASAPSLLGVCLGMQLLFERSAEGDVACLGLLPGTRASGSAGPSGCRTWAGTTSSPHGAMPAPSRAAGRLLLRALLRRGAQRPRGRGGRDRHRRPRGAQRGGVRPGGRRAVPPREERPRRPARCWRRGLLRRRIIPCLDVRGGRLVKGINFESLRDCGDPVDAAERYADAGRRRDRVAQHLGRRRGLARSAGGGRAGGRAGRRAAVHRRRRLVRRAGPATCCSPARTRSARTARRSTGPS